MPIELKISKKINKKKNSETERLNLLPRVGIYIDLFGREVSIKSAPSLETAYNVLKSGLTISNLKKITQKQLSEISFPSIEELKTVNTTAKEILKKKISLSNK